MRGNTASTTGRARPLLRRTLPLLALCALLSSSCSAANAQSWQCHAPEGTYQDHDIDVAEAVTQFTGEMMIRKADGLSRWHPRAKVAFNQRRFAVAGCQCNGVVATWYPENPKFFLVSLLADGKETPLGLVPYDKPVKFKVTFTWDGKLTLEVGTSVVTGTSSMPLRDHLELSCSTADVDFKVSVVPPIPPSTERCPFAVREQWTGADIERFCRGHG